MKMKIVKTTNGLGIEKFKVEVYDREGVLRDSVGYTSLELAEKGFEYIKKDLLGKLIKETEVVYEESL